MKPDPREQADFLSRMMSASRARLERALARCGESELRGRIARLPPPPAPRFAGTTFELIAEVKRRSPAAGQLASDTLAPAEQARRYASGGAIAVSVLTEPEEFAGDLAHVSEVARAVPGLPVMRKDFLVGTYQVLEARAAGAAGVLVIAAALEAGQTQDIIGCALELGMFVVVEVFDRADLAPSLPIVLAAAATAAGRGRVLLGVNCRNLRTLQVEAGRFAELAPLLPRAVPWVAESGITTPAQAGEVARLGYTVALVGTALMRSGDPGAAVRAFLEAGRGALTRGRGE
jgi:indole-3-glycerol phosphate synthase